MKLIDQINKKKCLSFNELVYLTGLAYIIDETQKQKHKQDLIKDKSKK